MVKNSKPKKNSSLFKKAIITGASLALAGLTAYYSLTRPEKLESYRELAKIEGIESILAHKGEVPDVIVMLQRHPIQTINETGIGGNPQNTRAIYSACNALYDKNNITSLVMEGLYPDTVKKYETRGKVSLTDDSGGYVQLLEKLLNERKWDLKSPENEETQKESDTILSQLREAYTRIKKDAKEQFSTYLELNKTNSLVFLEDATKSFQKQLDQRLRNTEDYLLTPEKTQILYDHLVVQRDKQFRAACEELIQEGKKPVIVVIGAGHYETLRKRLEGLNYVFLRPEGLHDTDLKLRDLKEFRDRFTYPPIKISLKPKSRLLN